MVDELQLLHDSQGIRHFCFADDALTIDREATIGLCDEILSRGLKIAFHATTRTDCVDEEVLAKLAAAGCYGISYGIETGSEALLEEMNKENDIENSVRAMRLTRAAGIQSTALIIAGNIGSARRLNYSVVGDGVNDILSLRRANLGIAMESGSAAARSVAQSVASTGSA